jgi:hypothetical protein
MDRLDFSTKYRVNEDALYIVKAHAGLATIYLYKVVARGTSVEGKGMIFVAPVRTIKTGKTPSNYREAANSRWIFNQDVAPALTE